MTPYNPTTNSRLIGCHFLSCFNPEPSVITFKKGTQNFSTSDPTYTIPVVRTRNENSPATVKWRTKKAQRFDLSSPLTFGPRETEKNIVIDPRAHPGPIQPETFQLELFDPDTNAMIGERKTTLVNVTDGGEAFCKRILVSLISFFFCVFVGGFWSSN